MSSKRKNGEGSWGKKTINGVNYVRYSKTYSDLGNKRKEFYGRTTKDIKIKIEEFESKNHIISPSSSLAAKYA